MRTEDGSRRPLSLAICLLTPVVVLMLGVIAALAILLKAMPDLRSELARGFVPDGFAVQMPAAGDYALWWVTEETGDEAAEPRLPDGARVVVFRSGTSQQVEVNAIGRGSRRFGSRNSLLLGTFSATAGDEFEIKATGVGAPLEIAIAPVKVKKLLHVALTIGVVMVVDVLASIVILFVLLHRRRTALDDTAGVHSHESRHREPDED